MENLLPEINTNKFIPKGIPYLEGQSKQDTLQMDVALNIDILKNNTSVFSFCGNSTHFPNDFNSLKGIILNWVNASYQAKKEDYYIIAVRNLRKKINFLRLNNDFNNEEISDEEYSQEIENNPNKYIIDIKYLSDPNEIHCVNDIINRIGGDFTYDEVGELLSIDTENLKSAFTKLMK